MACGSQGVFSKLCVEPGASPHTFDTSSEPYKFLACTLGKKGKLVMQRTNTGSRSMLGIQSRQGPYLSYGDILMHPNPLDLDNWLPRILGANESSDTFALAETLPTFGVLVSNEADTEQTKDCVVTRAIFRGRSHEFEEGDAEPLEMIVQIAGKEHVTGTTYPSLSFTQTTAAVPYIFEEGVLTMNSVARTFYAFTLTIDNMVAIRYANNLYPVGLCPTGRRVTLDVDFQFTSANASDLFEYPNAGYSTCTLNFTNTTVLTTFSFNLLKAADLSPVIQGPGEVALRLRLIAFKTGSTNEITVTNDSTV